MTKIGILTYHYSNNFGGVLQSYALYQYLTSQGYNVEIIDYIPKGYKNSKILHATGLKKNIFKSKKEDLNPFVLSKRIWIKIVYNRKIIQKFDSFRSSYMKLSNRVNENNITTILKDYEAIIVGSDQIWTTSQRNKREYFLGFGESFTGKKVSYAADSTISEVNPNQLNKLRNELEEFHSISVRNAHSHEFVQTLICKSVPIVVDPTLLYDFYGFEDNVDNTLTKAENYILVYVLGKEIKGSNRKVIDKIKEIYGNLKVYSVVIPTIKFNLCNYADRVFYDLGPHEWIELIKNATFVYTDSYHGTLFSIKFRKSFLAYYAEEIRATRFKDLGSRYGIDRFIVNSIAEIDDKNSLNQIPDFDTIERLIKKHKETSEKFLHEALHID